MTDASIHFGTSVDISRRSYSSGGEDEGVDHLGRYFSIKKNADLEVKRQFALSLQSNNSIVLPEFTSLQSDPVLSMS